MVIEKKLGTEDNPDIIESSRSVEVIPEINWSSTFFANAVSALVNDVWRFVPQEALSPPISLFMKL